MLRTLKKNTKSKLKYMKLSESVVKRGGVTIKSLVSVLILLKIRYKHARIKDSNLLKPVVTGLEIKGQLI